MKRLATRADGLVKAESPVDETELQSRSADYSILNPKQFAQKYRSAMFSPVKCSLDGEEYEIQVNFCTNPFCRWYNMPQHEFDALPRKPHRYTLSGSSDVPGQAVIKCNVDAAVNVPGVVLQHYSVLDSNWSLIDEIDRLVTNDRVMPREPEYKFHKGACPYDGQTPRMNPATFQHYGKSKANGQRWRCKACRKITCTLPTLRQSTSYDQNRNDILHTFALTLLNRTPVRRTCEILQVGSGTYYHKMEWLYRRCLEFLERHEKPAFEDKRMGAIWVNTDCMQYYLNNVRKKGCGGKDYKYLEEKVFPTYIVASAEMDSRYVLRADVAYDWEMTTKDLERDTQLYKDDRLSSYVRKNARLRIQYSPQPPPGFEGADLVKAMMTPELNEGPNSFIMKLLEFEKRAEYVDGFHVATNYTAMAHFWLLRRMIAAKLWHLVTDSDASLISAFRKIFAPQILDGYAHHFVYEIDRDKSRKEAFDECRRGRNALMEWADQFGYSKKDLTLVAMAQLVRKLQRHSLFEFREVNGVRYPIGTSGRAVEHPMPTVDQGFRKVNCMTDLSMLAPYDLADMLFKVSSRATDAFFQQARRRLSILERPLVTGREGGGKTYIYANFNPKYAQYAITILRTYYNFCMAYRTRDGIRATPAQRLGIVKRQYDLKDIIYLK